MKLLIYSDVHLEFRNFVPPVDVEYDVVVLAGDIGIGVDGVRWAGSAFPPDKPVIYVHGNHEHYKRHQIRPNIGAAKQVAAPHVHVLDNDEVTIDGVRFLGGTLWTDFRLNGNAVVSASAALTGMNDFRVIEREPYGRLLPEDTVKLHNETKKYLQDNVKPGDVVVTHHGVSPKSVHPRYGTNDALSPAFCSDLEDVILATKPKLWIHGHVHDNFDYHVGTTRVVVNPRAYPGENGNFNDRFVVEV